MSETTSSPEPITGPVGTTAAAPTVVETHDVDNRGRRGRVKLNVAAAWVGIVAGVVFIVAVIFGTGFVLGASTGGGHHGGGHHRDGGGQMHQEGGHGWPGGFGPGGPGGFGPGGQGGQPGGQGGPGQGPAAVPSTQPGR